MSETTTQVQPAVETGPKPVTWAPVPKVNLLPIEMVEDRAFRRTQMLLAGAVVLTVGLVGVGTVWAQNGVDDAQAETDAAQARVSRLQVQQAEYASIPKIIERIEAAQNARQSIYANDVRWYRYLTTLARSADQAGIELVNMSVLVTTGTADAATGSSAAGGAAAGDMLTPGGIGTFTFSGTGTQYAQVSAWLEVLDEITGIQGSKLESATKTEEDPTKPPEVAFANTAVLDSEARSGRYQQKDAATGSAPAPGSATDAPTATS